ncbi:MAG TPA: DNA-binding domain-containing protein [Terriglobales bacterium]|nr:DNA-binding domain-containing protein [Terriglobales bacterium]
MISLLELQRQMASVVMQPMTRSEHMRKHSSSIAEELIKPNDRLTSFERLEIYNRQYWFRVLHSLAEDFPGVRAIIGAKQFRRMSEAYLAECPSRSFTLRDLGSQLPVWLPANPQWLGPNARLVLDMLALELAHIDAFDGLQRPVVTAEELLQAGTELKLQLQPYISLLELHYPVDDLLLAVRQKKRPGRIVSTILKSASTQHANIYLAVHRVDYSVHYKRLEPEAFRLLLALKNGADLQKAIESAFGDLEGNEKQQAQDLKEWFGGWQSLGWFCATPQNMESAKGSR